MFCALQPCRDGPTCRGKGEAEAVRWLAQPPILEAQMQGCHACEKEQKVDFPALALPQPRFPANFPPFHRVEATFLFSCLQLWKVVTVPNSACSGMNSTTTHHVGFVSEPNCGRGTTGLLWQCLTTIFLCIWCAQHMDVPARALSKKLAFIRSVSAIVLGIVCPELMCARAVIQWYVAGRLVRVLEEQKVASISKKQAFFIQTGGLQPMLKYFGSKRVLNLGLIAPSAFKEILRDPLGRDFVSELLNHLPTDNEIDDRSKADLLAKIIVCVQASWTAAQIVARLGRGINLSLLEVTTSSYIFLALLAYTFWFRKPYNVTLGGLFAIDERSYSRLVEKIDCHGLSTIDIIFDGLWNTPVILGEGVYNAIYWFLVNTFGTILAAIHCAAWKYAFPNRVEAIMWHSCSVLAGISLWAAVVLRSYPTWRDEPHWLYPLRDYLPLLSMLIYILARLCIIVEIFASLRSAPAEIYQQISWSSYFGHIGS